MTEQSPSDEGARATERAREEYREERQRRDEWDKQPFPKSRDREREANERTYWRAVAEIPNPGPVEPLTELQAFHAEQTDPPPGPYPDPPLGPYPDPVIKERPSEEAVYGRARSTRNERQGTEDRSSVARRTGNRGAGTDPGGREYDEPNFDGYDEDIREHAEGPPSSAAPERQSSNVRKSSNTRAPNVPKSAQDDSGARTANRETV